jgi:hypothetical protein
MTPLASPDAGLFDDDSGGCGGVEWEGWSYGVC